MDITIVYLFIGAIISWLVARALNRFFSKERRNEEIIILREARIKDKSIEKLKKEQKKLKKRSFVSFNLLKEVDYQPKN